MFEPSKNCLKLLRTLRIFWELFKTSENCLKLPRTVWDLQELSKNVLELLDTSKNYVRYREHFTRNHGRERWPFRTIVKELFSFFNFFWKCILNWLEKYVKKTQVDLNRWNICLKFTSALITIFSKAYFQTPLSRRNFSNDVLMFDYLFSV